MPGEGGVPDGATDTVGELTARRLVGLLAEPNRRRVVAAMILGASSITQVEVETGLTTREVTTALERLIAAGLVVSVEGEIFVLLAQAFERAARAEAPMPSPSGFPDESSERQRILDGALRDGRLTRMPSKHSHRLVLLDHLVQRFEPGEHYTERQVNAMLAEVDTDTATLRRYLVDYGMLDRSDGEYWRSGGTFAID